MSTYKKEVGTAVQNNAGDYTGAVEGQLWYNSTAASFQFRSVAATGAWATGTALNTARSSLGFSPAGTQSSALASGGQVPPATGNTESWNGTSWTEVNNLNTARYDVGSGGTATSNLVLLERVIQQVE